MRNKFPLVSDLRVGDLLEHTEGLFLIYHIEKNDYLLGAMFYINTRHLRTLEEFTFVWLGTTRIHGWGIIKG